MSIGIHHWYFTRMASAFLHLRFDAARFRKAAALIAISGLFLCAGDAVETRSSVLDRSQ